MACSSDWSFWMSLFSWTKDAGVPVVAGAAHVPVLLLAEPLLAT
jgi:hypothetical protein